MKLILVLGFFVATHADWSFVGENKKTYTCEWYGERDNRLKWCAKDIGDDGTTACESCSECSQSPDCVLKQEPEQRRCDDVPGFVDARGSPCEIWEDYQCSRAAGMYEYSREEQADIMKNCPRSCGLCDQNNDNQGDRGEGCGEVMCMMACEHGFEKDRATGCEVCRCKPAPGISGDSLDGIMLGLHSNCPKETDICFNAVSRNDRQKIMSALECVIRQARDSRQCTDFARRAKDRLDFNVVLPISPPKPDVAGELLHYCPESARCGVPTSREDIPAFLGCMERLAKEVEISQQCRRFLSANLDQDPNPDPDENDPEQIDRELLRVCPESAKCGYPRNFEEVDRFLQCMNDVGMSRTCREYLATNLAQNPRPQPLEGDFERADGNMASFIAWCSSSWAQKRACATTKHIVDDMMIEIRAVLSESEDPENDINIMLDSGSIPMDLMIEQQRVVDDDGIDTNVRAYSPSALLMDRQESHQSRGFQYDVEEDELSYSRSFGYSGIRYTVVARVDILE